MKYSVWIDTNLGDNPPDWEINTEPKSLDEALKEVEDCLKAGFPALITFEGKTPREDGLFSNPETD